MIVHVIDKCTMLICKQELCSLGLSNLSMKGFHVFLRATSHMRLRTRDHCTSSTLIGVKARGGPSSLHNTLGGSMEYVNARWM